MEEQAVMDLPLDKFFLYTEAEERRRKGERAVMVLDTAGAVGGIFTKDGLKKYLKILEGE